MTEQFTNGYALLIGVDENYVDKWALPDVVKLDSRVAGGVVRPDWTLA